MLDILNRATARRALLSASAGFPPHFADGSEGTLAAIRAIGFIQIDTNSTVARAHDHALWSRVPGYEPSMISGLETGPRRVFEYWAHSAAYLPLEDLRYCVPRMNRIRRDVHDWYGVDRAASRAVLERVEAEGPVLARDFVRHDGAKGAWWDWKPAKRALEYLFHAGELVSVTRKGFQKTYDLASRHLPPGFRDLPLSMEELAVWYVRRSLDVYGIVARDEFGYQRRDGRGGIRHAIDDALATGALVPVELEGCPGVPYVARPGIFEAAAGSGETATMAPSAFILSPFDPLIIQRKRLARLFGTDYSLECYLPAGKRVFGYFALPVLYLPGNGDGGFVGLMDAKADRASGVFRILRLRVELPAPERTPFIRAFGKQVRGYAAFCGCSRVECCEPECSPPGFAKKLEAALMNGA
ncbi:MAG: winged helix DNA-binding domain-containing protein [Spirochaetes bacterium]|nr:winged helix DNA-binding domain-containing protein [Spirochaetota bacterium]